LLRSPPSQYTHHSINLVTKLRSANLPPYVLAAVLI